MVEDEHDALLGRQALEASVELVTHGHGALGVGRIGSSVESSASSTTARCRPRFAAR